MQKPTVEAYFRQTAAVISVGAAVFVVLSMAGYRIWLREPGMLPLAYYLWLGATVMLTTALIVTSRLFFSNVQHEIQVRLAAAEAANRSLVEAHKGLLDALIVALDTRDHETQGHAIRVVALALAITDRLDCSPAIRRAITWGGLLHDIGKIGVPDSILRKPGPLTDTERQQMMQHAEVGYRMVRRVRILQEATRVVLHHHERWDGQGYPFGLQGKEIPVEARIFSVADAVDAMLSRRPYKAQRQLNDVYTEVERCSGTHFCPDAAAAFLSIPKEDVRKILSTAEQSFVDDTWLDRIARELVPELE
jgi:putative nucleotidyltransferase with HDIG domain